MRVERNSLLVHTSIFPILDSAIPTAVRVRRKSVLFGHVWKSISDIWELTNPCRSTCTVGSDCCGRSIYYAVYRNPNLLGCYEPPIPGTSLIGTATYPVACFSTVYTQTIQPTKVFVNPNPTGVFNPWSTPPRQYDWTISTSGSSFEYLGCYSADTLITVAGTNLTVSNPQSMTPILCAAHCSVYPFFSVNVVDGFDRTV